MTDKEPIFVDKELPYLLRIPDRVAIPLAIFGIIFGAIVLYLMH